MSRPILGLALCLAPFAAQAQEAFDPASCPTPLLALEEGRATLIYDPEMAARVPARAGLVPVVDRASGRVWYYDPAETSLFDILTLHGAHIADHRGPIECAMTAAGFPDPTRRTRDLLVRSLDLIGGAAISGDGGSRGEPPPSGGREGVDGLQPPGNLETAACTSGPRDGTWRAEIGATRIEGCPAMMVQAFGQMSGALPGFDAAPGRLNFACPFHPDTLELSRTARVRWTATGPNSWRTTDLGAEAFGQIPAGAGGGSHIRWDLSVVSPEEIQFQRSVEIVLPAAAAAAMGMTAGGCRILGTDRWMRTGD